MPLCIYQQLSLNTEWTISRFIDRKHVTLYARDSHYSAPVIKCHKSPIPNPHQFFHSQPPIPLHVKCHTSNTISSSNRPFLPSIYACPFFTHFILLQEHMHRTRPVPITQANPLNCIINVAKKRMSFCMQLKGDVDIRNRRLQDFNKNIRDTFI